ncbi:MAG TPA: hypothetical protein VNS09_12725 [Solirubrobacter sp.]|nr:hypothetical protein [Solirubrobacter sp.]
MPDWYTVDSEEAQQRLLGAWRDAPLINLELTGMILDVARGQVLQYGAELLDPLEQLAEDVASLGYDQETIDNVLALLDGEPFAPPVRYVYAQLQQAKNLWNAGRGNEDGEIGEGGFTFTPRPLDKTIRGIIRPVDGKPHVL